MERLHYKGVHAYVKYESPIFNGSKIMVIVKFFSDIQVKGHGQDHKDKEFGMNRRITQYKH